MNTYYDERAAFSPIRPYHPAGLAAAKHEVLLTCPCCGTPNFTERGLRGHNCRAKPDRSRLTPDELFSARQKFTA